MALPTRVLKITLYTVLRPKRLPTARLVSVLLATTSPWHLGARTGWSGSKLRARLQHLYDGHKQRGHHHHPHVTLSPRGTHDTRDSQTSIQDGGQRRSELTHLTSIARPHTSSRSLPAQRLHASPVLKTVDLSMRKFQFPLSRLAFLPFSPFLQCQRTVCEQGKDGGTRNSHSPRGRGLKRSVRTSASGAFISVRLPRVRLDAHLTVIVHQLVG